MGGGLMQLVAYGAQDIYLSGNPQITFFKVVYRRHTNFSTESVVQTLNGNATFGKKATCTVSRNGDLLTHAYLHVGLPSLSEDDWDLLLGPSPALDKSNYELCWTNYVGLAMIDHIKLEIGGQEIDKHYGTWMYIWKELTMTKEKSEGYKRMVGGTDSCGWLLLGNAALENELHIPLDFWFNVNPGLALPLIALQYHEVKFHFEFRHVKDLVVLCNKDDGHILDPKLYSIHANNIQLKHLDFYLEYVYLDTDERRRFAQMSHEYLIEQVQTSSTTTVSTDSYNSRLNFNHPCKELIWTIQREDNVEYNDWFNFSSFGPGDEKIGNDILKKAVLKLNGHDRFGPERGPLYFRQLQPFHHHTNIPDSNIYVYSFALRPEEHQPSGTCNMSRIDNANLHLKLNKSTVSPVHPTQTEEVGVTHVTVYARNYNVLRIMSGMGGMAYSN